MHRIIGIDPGNEASGMVVLDYPNIVVDAFNVKNRHLFAKITNYLYKANTTIVIEDIRAYSTPLTPQIIDTCKFIGEAVYRLRIASGLNVELLPRSAVKKWVFDAFRDVCTPMIEQKMLRKVFLACKIQTKEEIKVLSDGSDYRPRKASFVYIDDNMVTEAMRGLYSIEKVGRGKKNAGIKSHSFQALAVASCFQAINLDNSFSLTD